MTELDREEKEVLEAYEWKAQALKGRSSDSEAAQSIRRSNVLAEGIPYQTLIASVLHKYVEDRLREGG